MMENQTRRGAVFAALAGLAAPMPAHAGDVRDPIYAAIERQRVAWADFEAAHLAALDGKDSSDCSRVQRALDVAFAETEALAATVPTTLAGVVALLEYLHKFESVVPQDHWHDGLPEGFEAKVRESVRVALAAMT